VFGKTNISGTGRKGRKQVGRLEVRGRDQVGERVRKSKRGTKKGEKEMAQGRTPKGMP